MPFLCISLINSGTSYAFPFCVIKQRSTVRANGAQDCSINSVNLFRTVTNGFSFASCSFVILVIRCAATLIWRLTRTRIWKLRFNKCTLLHLSKTINAPPNSVISSSPILSPVDSKSKDNPTSTVSAMICSIIW